LKKENKSEDETDTKNENNHQNQYKKSNNRLPKNLNEYRQIIDTLLSRDSDVEWIFDLRGYQKKKNFMNLKTTSINQPSFYNDDFDKYKKKVEKEMQERKNNTLYVKGNIGTIEHLVTKRLNFPPNNSQIGFDGTLRQFQKFETIHGPPATWKSLNISPKKTLLDTFLPPLTKNSIRNLGNINKYVSRPYESSREVNE
jgi:hypothetical protein